MQISLISMRLCWRGDITIYTELRDLRSSCGRMNSEGEYFMWVFLRFFTMGTMDGRMMDDLSVRYRCALTSE
jgi:hypothetical protein